MKKISEAWFGNNNNGTCYCCGKKTTNNVRITEDGYVSRSYSLNICESHIETKSINGVVFSKVDNELFYEYNADYGIFGFWKPVKSYGSFEYYKNIKEREFLDGVIFEYDKF